MSDFLEKFDAAYAFARSQAEAYNEVATVWTNGSDFVVLRGNEQPVSDDFELDGSVSPNWYEEAYLREA